jgi:hypothetical protein
MKKNIFTVIFTYLFTLNNALFSQTHFGISGQLGIPINEFRENTNAIGGGLGLNFYTPFDKRVPIFFGLNFGYMIYGSNSQRLNQNVNITSSNGTFITSLPLNLGITTNNNLINTNVAIRFKAPFEMIQPYVEALGGFNYLYTRTRITDESPNRIFTNNPNNPNGYNNTISARTQINSFAWSYGAGLGFMMRLGNSVYLDVRGSYMRGGEAEYYDRSQTQNWRIVYSGSGTFNPNNPTDLTANADGTPKKSTTDMFMMNLGITFQIQ